MPTHASEDALRARLALQAGGLIAWEVDIGTQQVLGPPELSELFGLEPGPPDAQRFSDRMHPDDEPRTREQFAAALSGGTASFDFRVILPDGSLRWLHSVCAFSPERGTVIGYTSDITERKEAEERLLIALAGAALGSWQWALDTGKVIYSDRWAEMLGYTVDEIEPGFAGWERLLDPIDKPRVLALVDDYINGRSQHYECEFRMKHKNGSRVWVLTQGKIVRRDKDGRPQLFIGTHLDVTKRRTAEEALKASEARMKALMEAAPVGITFSRDISCESVTGNQAAIEQFEVARHDNISASAIEPNSAGLKIAYYSGTQRVGHHELPLQRAARENRKVGPVELEVHLPSGRVWTCEATGAPIRDAEGNVIAAACVTVDITERKRASAREKFLMGEVNHRAKNLLTVVKSIAEQTRAFTGPETYVEALGKRIDALSASHDLLVASNWQQIDLEALVRGQIAALTHGLDPRIAMSGAPVIVHAAAAQTLGLCIHELTTNALKHGCLRSDQGRVAIHWSNARDGQFDFSWRESGNLPPAPGAPVRSGFGTRVLISAVEYEMDGTASITFDGANLLYSLSAPVRAILGTADVYHGADPSDRA